MARYLNRVVLDTGHYTKFCLADCDDGAWQQWLRACGVCETGRVASVSSPHGAAAGVHSMAPDTAGISQYARVWALTDGVFGPVLVTVALGLKSRPGAAVWRLLHDINPAGASLATQRDKRPAAPWLGVVVRRAGRHRDRLAWLPWLEDASANLAWAWIQSFDNTL